MRERSLGAAHITSNKCTQKIHVRVSQFESHFRHETAFTQLQSHCRRALCFKKQPRKSLVGVPGLLLCVCVCACLYVCVCACLSTFAGIAWASAATAAAAGPAWSQASPRGLRCVRTSASSVYCVKAATLTQTDADTPADKASAHTLHSTCLRACVCVSVRVCPACFLG